MRLKNIDLLKGALIVLVIAGHIILGSTEESFLRYVIYSFHMPIFIGISGFLFNYKEIGNATIISLFIKYFKRLILPWLFASFAYILYNHLAGMMNEFSFKGIIKSVLIPYTHLWFIPAFLSWVFMTWFFIKIKLPPKVIFAISLLISTISYLIFKNPYKIEEIPALDNFWTTIFGIFRPYFYSFFVLGFVLKQTEYYKHKIRITEIIYVVVFFVAIIMQYFFHSIILLFITFFSFNYLLLNKVLKLAGRNSLPQNKILEWMGQNSLGIYLWHLFPILLAKQMMGTNQVVYFYATAIFFAIIYILVYAQLAKIRIINKYVFGMNSK